MQKTKLIEEFDVTDASVHDSQATENLLNEQDEGQPVFTDSAYTCEDQEKVYKKKRVINKINEKGYRNKHLTDEQKVNNKEKSKTRARVKHILGLLRTV